MNTIHKRIILGSTSPRRKEILGILGIPFEIRESNYKEDMSLQKTMSPSELVLFLSRGKGENVVSQIQNLGEKAIIITADTFVVFEGACLGKPFTKEKQREMLELFSKKKIEIITGIYVHDIYNEHIYSESISSAVHFKELNNNLIDRYINTDEGLDKAGGFAVQEKGNILIDSIEGDRYNIVGLPLSRIFDILQECGIGL